MTHGGEVLNGGLQGYIPSPVLFNIFTNDLNNRTACTVSRFSNDIRWMELQMLKDGIWMRSQNDLKELEKCSKIIQLNLVRTHTKRGRLDCRLSCFLFSWILWMHLDIMVTYHFKMTEYREKIATPFRQEILPSEKPFRSTGCCRKGGGGEEGNVNLVTVGQKTLQKLNTGHKNSSSLFLHCSIYVLQLLSLC